MYVCRISGLFCEMHHTCMYRLVWRKGCKSFRKTKWLERSFDSDTVIKRCWLSVFWRRQEEANFVMHIIHLCIVLIRCKSILRCKRHFLLLIECVWNDLYFWREETRNRCQRFGGHRIPPMHLHVFSLFNFFYAALVPNCSISPAADCGSVDDEH